MTRRALLQRRRRRALCGRRQCCPLARSGQPRRSAPLQVRLSFGSCEADLQSIRICVAPANWRMVASATAACSRFQAFNSVTAGEYSNEKLQQLRQQTKAMPGAPTAAAKKAVEPTGGFKLSGSFKAAKKPADDRYEVNASDMVSPCMAGATISLNASADLWA